MKGRGDAPERGVVAPVYAPECMIYKDGQQSSKQSGRHTIVSLVDELGKFRRLKEVDGQGQTDSDVLRLSVALFDVV